jgi:hypothetical protein
MSGATRQVFTGPFGRDLCFLRETRGQGDRAR